MLEAHRKRGPELGPAPGTAGQPRNKKARASAGVDPDSSDDAATGAAGGVNGAVTEEDVQLETFRKEAIWRQMQEYKREHARAKESLEASEVQKADAEAKLAAVDVCWTQLIEDVRMLFRGSSASAEANGTDADPLATLPLTAGPAFTDALKLRSTASKDLILHLLSRASPPPGTAPDVDEFRARCRELTAETVASRAALGVADGRIKQLQDSLEQAEDRLRRAEKRLDRERSKIVRQVEGKPSTSASAGEGTSAAGEASTSAATGEDRPDAAKVAAEGVKSEGASDDERGINGRVVKKDPDGPVAIVNGVDPAELEGARDAAEASARELEAMKGVLSERTTELDNLKFRLSALPEYVVANSDVYKNLLEELRQAKAAAEQAQEALEVAQAEATGYRERQEEFRNAVLAEAQLQIDDLEKRVQLRDADATRLRQTREDVRAELLEVKARDDIKVQQIEEIRTLANSRMDMVEALQSEVRRCRMALAAARGDQEAVAAYAASGEEDVVQKLQERLKSAEALAATLQDQVASLTKHSSNAAALARSEQEARSQALALQERLSKLEALVDPTSAQPDVADLAKKLEEKVEAVKVLEAKVKAAEATAPMLMGEIDRLSSAWSLLDEQSRSKVYKLAEQEEKVMKAVQEKAKADNKYFAAMRANEQLKGENAVLEKVALKQTVAIEKLNEDGKSVMARFGALEKEVSSYDKANAAYKSSVADLTRANADLANRLASSARQLADLQGMLRERNGEVEAQTLARSKAEETANRTSKELERTTSKLNAAKTGTIQSAEVAELKSFNEDLTKMLKCNSCKQRFKTHALTRCMHMGCQPCIDKLIETRQRRCFVCQLSFGAADVAQVYF